MRRSERETSRESALKTIDQCEWAVLSMRDGEGVYSLPISVVREDEFIYFHCAKQGKKIDCLRENPQVCLVCVGSAERAEEKYTMHYESAIINGTAAEITDPGEKVHVLRVLCERYAPNHMGGFEKSTAASLEKTSIWQIKIDSITGKANR